MVKGGAVLPLRYFDPYAEQSSAFAGNDVLGVNGLEVRPKIGGKASQKAAKRLKRTTRRVKGFTKFTAKGGFTQFAAKGGFTKFAAKGGFIPSIMEPFIIGCSKYIVPLAALSGWKLQNRPTTRKSKHQK